MNIERLWHITQLFIRGEGFRRAEYIKKKNIFGSIGNNCYYHPFTIPAESKLIEMGDNVVISKGVELVTHDMTWTLFKNDKILPSQNKYPYYRKGIKIGNNVMIGINSIILPGVFIGNHVVIGGGAS